MQCARAGNKYVAGVEEQRRPGKSRTKKEKEKKDPSKKKKRRVRQHFVYG